MARLNKVFVSLVVLFSRRMLGHFCLIIAKELRNFILVVVANNGSQQIYPIKPTRNLYTLYLYVTMCPFIGHRIVV